MDIFIALFIMAVLYRLKIKKPGKQFADDYFSPGQCRALRGIFAVVVVLHHISNITEGGFLFDRLYHFGVLGTAGFFIISGYGLTVQLKTKRDSYLKGFIPKRLGVIVIPYVIFFVIYYLYEHFANGCTIQKALISLYNGDPIVKNSWYILAIIYLYIVYYINAKLFFTKNKTVLFMIGNLTGVIIYMLMCRKLHYGMWWYNTAPCFWAGVVLSVCEKKILKTLKKHYTLPLIINLALIAALYAAKASTKRGSGINYFITLFFSFAMAVFIPLICMKVDFSGNTLMNKIGVFSLELYLLHGLIIEIVQKISILNTDEPVFTLSVLVISIPAAAVIHIPIEKLCSLYKNKLGACRKKAV